MLACLHSQASEPSPVSRRTPQAVPRPEAFLLEKHWVRLEEPRTIHQMITVLRETMNSFGVTHPTEGTLKSLVAILMCAGQQTELGADGKYDLLLQVKVAFSTNRTVGGSLPHIANYPVDPKHMHSGWQLNAYGDETPPVNCLRDYPIASLARAIPARVSNAQVREQHHRTSGG